MRKSKRKRLCKLRRRARQAEAILVRAKAVACALDRLTEALGRVRLVAQDTRFSAEKTRVQIPHSL
jgi:uncharacterized sporulation protein YeaH/YhbH (DUF444 family)